MRTVPVGSLDTLLETLDLRRPAVAAHSRRVAMAARKLGMAVGLDVQELADLTTAALVHDAGSLLGRPTNLLDLEEWCGLSEDVSDILWYSSRPYGHHKHAPLDGANPGRGAHVRRADLAAGISGADVARDRPHGDRAGSGPPLLPAGRQRADDGAARAGG